MAGSKRDSDGARGAESRQLASLRQLAASLPSFDQALDDFIARAHQTDPAVGDAAGTYRNEPAADDSITGVHRARPVPADSITRVHASGSAVDDPVTRVQPSEIAVGDDDVIAAEPVVDAIDPDAYPTNPEHRERAEALHLALGGQLAGLQRRLAAAEAQQPALREQITSLQRRLSEAEARNAGAAAARGWIGLAAGLAFIAGVAVMFAISRFILDHPGSSRARLEPAVNSAPAAAPFPSAPIITPIDPPPSSSTASGSPSQRPAATASPATTSRPASAPPTAHSTDVHVGAAKPSRADATASDPARPSSSSGIVDPFARPAAPTAGSAGQPAGSPPHGIGSPPAGSDPASSTADTPRDAGVIVDPF